MGCALSSTVALATELWGREWLCNDTAAAIKAPASNGQLIKGGHLLAQ